MNKENSKGMLVFDLPSYCEECPFVIIDRETEKMKCGNPLSLKHGSFVDNNKSIKSKDCPIKELPRKKDTAHMFTETGLIMAESYNVCLREILSEK